MQCPHFSKWTDSMDIASDPEPPSTTPSSAEEPIWSSCVGQQRSSGEHCTEELNGIGVSRRKGRHTYTVFKSSTVCLPTSSMLATEESVRVYRALQPAVPRKLAVATAKDTTTLTSSYLYIGLCIVVRKTIKSIQQLYCRLKLRSRCQL